ncbi:hypothetical protein D9757_009256 [Collybiopsis confluens]|uniref:O-methyltransferase domain-containing protein n=1 Tax=Collybiopsis confluens TaxID=2823264 RepID=A0A8H5HA61_9AGAR|nr:hypothetical protein D9757_009256 [Collybiopsis confluens]
MSEFDNSHITALTDLINKAVQDVITEYASVGQAVPSLDTLNSGPFTTPDETPVQLTRAIQIIEAACAQLVCTVAPPASVIVNKALRHQEPACLVVATEAKIADLLLNKPEGVSASELAARSGLSTPKLTRLLRFLATRHCFKEVQPRTFANNRLSMKLLSSDPISSTVGLLADEGLLASAYLNETLSNPAGEEVDGGVSFQNAVGSSLFEYYKTDSGLKKGERFSRAMVGWGTVTGKVYPWASLPPNSVICDIGGGNGHVIMDLLKVYPHLKLVLQDQPQVIEMAKKFWKEDYPAGLELRQVEFVPFDFFKDAAMEGCDIYYIRFVLHDWRDADCQLILKNVRKVMKPGSRVIIHDTVIREALQNEELSEASGDQHFDHGLTTLMDTAPKPLLPNYGVGRIRSYELDILMMTLLNAQSRTLDEFVTLW